MNEKILLVGRNPTVLAQLAEALLQEEYVVKTTNRVEQASQEFNAADFDLIAFGRVVDEQTKVQLRTNFSGQNQNVFFVDGLAPVISLLVKQINVALLDNPIAEKVITDFRYKQTEVLHLFMSTSIDCQITIDLYLLDAFHHTQHKTLVSEFVMAGHHTYQIHDVPDTTSTINFLIAEVAALDLAVLTLH